MEGFAAQDHAFRESLSTGSSNAHPTTDTNAASNPKRKRASRKGQPKRFSCNYEGCDRSYSRAEHLARHQLNHSPKEVFRCEVEGCNHTFVRPDLFARHKARHEEPQSQNTLAHSVAASSPQDVKTAASLYQPIASKGDAEDLIENAAKKPKLASVDSTISVPAAPTASTWPQMPLPQGLPTPGPSMQTQSSPMNRQLPPLSSLPAYNSPWMAPTSVGAFNHDFNGDQTNENFASWLFDSPGSHNSGFDFNNMPFLDFGMDYSMSNMFGLEDGAMQGLLGSRTYSSNSVTSEPRQSDAEEDPHIRVSENRRAVVTEILSNFMTKKRPRADHTSQPESILLGAESGQWSNMSAAVLESCIATFWREVASQMPIVHEPTFSASRCQPLLLLAILALGAGALVRTHPQGSLQDYRAFADFLAINLRWEIFIHDDAQPPVHLWVAQSLLLLEHYEKMYSTRQLHERAHIHHSSTLTLLRRGSPMVGRTESETPPSGPPTRQPSPAPGTSHIDTNMNPEIRSWWKRWVSNESMNRVVFAAFQMDTLHASMFGHSADLLPHELRLQLPCDDSLWTATSAEEVRRLESTFAMYRIKTVNFLDGLKRCLHGYEVQTHHYARMVLMSGLLSVGWHINRREKHVQFVETVPSVQEQARWRSLLLQAFGHWRRSFDEVLDHNAYRSGQNRTRSSSKDMSDPTVLFHLAHMTMHIDIIDVQILSGSRRLLGRKVSDRDRASVVQRMRVWASTSMARHAALHAFKLLESTFCAKRFRQTIPSPQNGWSSVAESTYTCRSDTFVYRPWILGLAGMTIWAYQYACPQPASHQQAYNNARNLTTACQYIATCAATDNEDRLPLLISKDGCGAVLQILMDDFATAESEIMLEASKRMQDCLKKLDAVDFPMVNR